MHQTSELGVQKVGKKRDFSVLKMLSLPCYLGIATTLKPNNCDQTARAEKRHKEREKKEIEREEKRGKKLEVKSQKKKKKKKKKSVRIDFSTVTPAL